MIGDFSMKKVAVLWSSPNLDGLTAGAKARFVSGLEEAGAEVQEFHLNRMHLEHCRACGNGWGTCSKKGSCVILDDFAQVYEALREADGIQSTKKQLRCLCFLEYGEPSQVLSAIVH